MIDSYYTQTLKKDKLRDPSTGVSSDDEWFPIDLEFVDKIWLPDVEVLNLKVFQSLTVLSKLQGLWVSPKKEVLYVLATRVTFICAMSFDAFPLDVQQCLLQVGSFNFDNRKMVFDSYLLPRMPNHTKSILDYDVLIRHLEPKDTFFVPAETGNYSVTGFELILTRRMSHYMITYYLPSSLFVVVSWTSFLIPSEDIQGRMALLVTLFLVLLDL
nr:glycine receptor subunit alpha-3-like [Lepeophtheirus salmonis]